MKYEWRKQEKHIYVPKEEPVLIKIPNFKYIIIEGKGNPNSQEFSDKVSILYQVSYAIRMMPKKGYTPEGYFEYTVYPLEGVWDLSTKGRQLPALDKNELIYTIMIRQPEFVTETVFKQAIELTRVKNNIILLNELKFESIEEGLCVQMMHIGSYDEEPRTFSVMRKYIQDHNLELVTKVHREIYLSDARKVEPQKQKTILRYQVKNK